jgi:quinol monooxygenase YgiN
MTYYHLRYNVYEDAGFPVEKERWMMFDQPSNDFQVKQHLEREHGNKVSIIVSKVISLEEFELNHQTITK